MDDIFRTKEAAKYLKVGEAYIRQLIRLKKLRAYGEGRRGGYRILKEDINRYIRKKLKTNNAFTQDL
jgi:excisionase family DNA binding protein